MWERNIGSVWIPCLIALAWVLAAWLALSLFLKPTEAQAQACGDHSEMTGRLKSLYRETLRSIGRASDEHLVEVFASEHGSWTILVTNVEGRSCLVATGKDWRDIGQPKGRLKGSERRS